MIRGGLAFSPRLLGATTRMVPYAKNAAIPLALGALSSRGDNVVDSIFGASILNCNMSHPLTTTAWNMCHPASRRRAVLQKDRGLERLARLREQFEEHVQHLGRQQDGRRGRRSAQRLEEWQGHDGRPRGERIIASPRFQVLSRAILALVASNIPLSSGLDFTTKMV